VKAGDIIEFWFTPFLGLVSVIIAYLAFEWVLEKVAAFIGFEDDD